MRAGGRRLRLRGPAGISGCLVALSIAAGVLWMPGTALAAATNPALVGSVSDPVSLSGVTSVAATGNFFNPNYAYATAYYRGTLAAIDISNPAQPTIVGESAIANSLLNASTVNIAGGYAYVVSKNRNGASGSNSNDDGTGNSLTILDITTNPAQPLIVGSLRDPVNLFGAYGVAVSGQYVYVAAQGCLSGQPCPNPNVGDSFAVIDASTPSNPTLVATLKNSALPAPWTGTGALKHATAVAVSGNYAYVTASYSNRLTVIDISNPLSPTIVASLQDSSKLGFDVDVAVSGGYAYVADQGTALGRLAVVDVHDPINPQIVGLVTSSSSSLNGAYRVRVRGNFAYTAAITAKAVTAVDISNPLAPRVAGSFTSNAYLNRSTGVDVDSTGRYVIATSPYLSSQTQPLYPPYPFQTGGPTMTGTVSEIDLDPVPIAVTITAASKPGNPTTQTSANFAFTTTDAIASLRCRLDGAPFGLCTTFSSQTFSSLSPGSHTFVVQATDAAGNTSTDTYSWSISVVTSTADPVTPVLDNFNRANGGAGTNWSLIRSSGFAPMNISGNAAVDSSTSLFAWNYWNPANFGPDSEGYVTVASYGASDTIRIGARVTGGTNTHSGYYVAVKSTGDWLIIRIDNGSSTPVTLASVVAQAISAGDKIGIRAVGSTVTALRYTAAAGWVQVLSYDTSSDPVRYTAGGRLALEFRTSIVDDFGGGTLPVLSPPANSSPPTIAGSLVEGQTLTASPGNWSGNPAPTFTYQWQRCDSAGTNCNPILNANSSTYLLAPADVGSTIVVAVTGTNGSGSTGPVASTATAVVKSAVDPVTPVLDNFNRANGGAGSNWSLIRPSGFAAMNVSGNAAVNSSASLFAWNYWNVSNLGPNCEGYVTVASYGASDTLRIGARVTGGTNAHSGYYTAISSAGAWSIIRIDNGASVTLASGVTRPISTSNKIGIRIVGSVVTALHYTTAAGWVQVLSYNTSSDPVRYTTAGRLALEFKTSTLDDLGGGTLP